MPLVVGSGATAIQSSDETTRLISESNKWVNFLKDRRVESELGEREFYFLEGGR